MNLKHGFAAAVVVLAATMASIGVAQLQAAEDPRLGYCPSRPRGIDCTTAVQMFLQFGRHTDNELIMVINDIVTDLNGSKVTLRGYADTARAIRLLADTIRDSRKRNGAEEIANAVASSKPAAPFGSKDVSSGGQSIVGLVNRTNPSSGPTSSSSGGSSSSGAASSGSSGANSGPTSSSSGATSSSGSS